MCVWLHTQYLQQRNQLDSLLTNRPQQKTVRDPGSCYWQTRSLLVHCFFFFDIPSHWKSWKRARSLYIVLCIQQDVFQPPMGPKNTFEFLHKIHLLNGHKSIISLAQNGVKYNSLKRLSTEHSTQSRSLMVDIIHCSVLLQGVSMDLCRTNDMWFGRH